MYLGFLTVCLPEVPFDELVKWAAEKGFKGLEVGCWPQKSDRDYKGSCFDVTKMTTKSAKETRKLVDDNGITISSLAYYDNNLHPDKKNRAYIHNHLYKVIDAAALLGVESVGTFIGNNPALKVEDALKEAQGIFKKHLQYARKKKVKLMIENCPMEGWQQENVPGNLMYSPELWEKVFNLLPDENFGLNIDPSHLYWLGCDYVDCIQDFKDRIFHAHAKDTEILEGKMAVKSIYSKGWWRYRMPGLGEVDWRRFTCALQEAGYKGVMSIEHEDPIYHGSEEKTKQGLILGHRYLSNYII